MKRAWLLLILIFCFLLSVPMFATIGDPVWSANDYETYEENIDSYPLPQGFVYYEDMAFMGDFCRFFGMGMIHYSYTMRSLGTEFLIRIDSPNFKMSLSEEDYPKLEVSYTEMEDLRFLQNAPGHILIKDAAFVYRDTGELFMIRWEDGFGRKTLSLYEGAPKGEFWDRLFNPETVDAALDQLFRATRAENTVSPWLWIALPVGVVAVGAVTVVLLRRKKKPAPAEVTE